MVRLLAAATLSQWLPFGVSALEPEQFAVHVSATVQSSPPEIRLHWPLDPWADSYEVYRKTDDGLSWGAPLANLPANATGFVDSNVAVGRPYEYQIVETTRDYPWPSEPKWKWKRAYGYIFSGIEVPLIEQRGKILLLVDDRFSQSLASELQQLETDLVGDGWRVIRHDVSPDASVVQTKRLIQDQYRADPTGLRSVLLLGHIPVPYSGDLYPDFHESHRGAWPADVYYGEMDGQWTDSEVHSTTAEDPRNYNIPGDGKFDQSTIPSQVELEVGRVDFYEMPAFSEGEEELLRRYLNKNHAFRHRTFQARRRGLIRDQFGEVSGDAPAASAWRAFPPFFGRDQIIVVGPGEFLPTLARDSYLWSYAGGGGGYHQADGVGSTSDFVSSEIQSVFLMLHGSFFGDWDRDNVLLRAPLAARGMALASAWVGLPHWFVHHMALGQTIGYATRVTQNNHSRSFYKNQVNDSVAQIHIALMGDPSLRMHPVAPPSNLSASVGSGVVLQWKGSPDSVVGYHIYRAESPRGPFSRLTPSPVTGARFHDPAPGVGQRTYMVRAIKLETTPSGSYFNASQGVFASVTTKPSGTFPALSVTASDATASEDGADTAAFLIESSEPLPAALQLELRLDGSAVNGVDYESILTRMELSAGSREWTVTIRSRPDEEVEGDETVVLSLLAGPGYALRAPAAATATIIDAPNEAPVPAPDQFQTPENQPLPIKRESLLENDVDPNSFDPLTISQVDEQSREGGSIQSEGQDFLYTPSPGFYGIDTFHYTVVDQAGATASAEVAVTVLPNERIRRIGLEANQTVTLHFTGTPATPYTVQSSVDLSGWKTLGKPATDPSGRGTFVDSSGTADHRRFYRLQR